MISGAISLAVKEINTNGKLKEMGHSLEFIVAETYGEEVSSIRQTARLWTEKVYAYIGPQGILDRTGMHKYIHNRIVFIQIKALNI